MTRDPVIINTQICEALGLDPDTTESVTLRFVAQQTPVVDVKAHVFDGTDLAERLSTYELVEPTDPAGADNKEHE